MGFRAAFTSAVRAVSRPYLVLPAAFVAVIALLSPPAIEDASAQGFRMQGSRGGFSSTGPGRFQSSIIRGMASKSAILQGGKSGPPSGGNNIVTGPGTGMAAWRHGQGGMAGMRGMGGRRPGSTADTRPPKGGDHRPPPGRFPIPPIVMPPGRHRRHAAGRSHVGSAVERRWWWRWWRRHRLRNRTSRPPTGAAMCRTRWWSKSHPPSRRRR